MHAYKTGMLYDSANTHAVASTMKLYYEKAGMKPKPPLVVDPVCVSTSGHTLLEDAALRVMVDELFPLSTIITPNKSEAELLLSHVEKTKAKPIDSLPGAIKAAQELSQAFGTAILLKGGHLLVHRSDILDLLKSEGGSSVEWDRAYDDDMEILRTPDNLKGDRDGALVIDILVEPQFNNVVLFSRARIDTDSTHGTGCTLSAALACYLAKGYSCEYFMSITILLKLMHLRDSTKSNRVGDNIHIHGNRNRFLFRQRKWPLKSPPCYYSTLVPL